MTQIARSIIEPEEREDPVNGFVELAESAVRLAIEHGGDRAAAVLKKRLARWLTPASPEPKRTAAQLADHRTTDRKCETEADARRAYDVKVKRCVDTVLAGLPRERRLELEEAFARSLPSVQAALFRTKRKFTSPVCWPEAREFLPQHLDLDLPSEPQFIAAALGDAAPGTGEEGR